MSHSASGVAGRVALPTAVAQSERFDPQGAFIRRRLPELAGVAEKFIRAPRKLPREAEQAAGCRIGDDSPARLPAMPCSESVRSLNSRRRESCRYNRGGMSGVPARKTQGRILHRCALRD
ncbi:MAG: FAD-binding domain-containing protein [Pseudomonadota bacterium]